MGEARMERSKFQRKLIAAHVRQTNIQNRGCEVGTMRCRERGGCGLKVLRIDSDVLQSFLQKDANNRFVVDHQEAGSILHGVGNLRWTMARGCTLNRRKASSARPAAPKKPDLGFEQLCK